MIYINEVTLCRIAICFYICIQVWFQNARAKYRRNSDHAPTKTLERRSSSKSSLHDVPKRDSSSEQQHESFSSENETSPSDSDVFSFSDNALYAEDDDSAFDSCYVNPGLEGTYTTLTYGNTFPGKIYSPEQILSEGSIGSIPSYITSSVSTCQL